jgi:hypothetical protein
LTPTSTSTRTFTHTPTQTPTLTPIPEPRSAHLTLRITNPTDELRVARLSGNYIGGPVIGGFAMSYGPFLQAVPPGTFDIVVNQTLNEGPWLHRVTVTSTGQNDTQQTVLDADVATNIVVWVLQ